MLIPDPRRTPLPNLISHNGVILYQWEFLRARLDEGEGLPWIAMDIDCSVDDKVQSRVCRTDVAETTCIMAVQLAMCNKRPALESDLSEIIIPPL